MPRVIVIGAGISGLTVAYRLSHHTDLELVIFERENRFGGKAQTEVAGGFTCEEATNSWLDKEPVMRELLDDLGLATRIQPASQSAERRFIYRADALREIALNPVKFMGSSVLPLRGRLRLAMEPFVRKGNGSTDETLAHFAARRLGPLSRDILIGPMAAGVYAGDPEKMSLKSCFPKVYDLEQRYGGLIKGMVALKKEKRRAGEDPSTVQAGPSGRMTSLKGGVGELTHALARALGSRVRLGTAVREIHCRADGRFDVFLEGEPTEVADVVVSAAPAWSAENYLRTLDPEAADAFAGIPYPSLDVVCLGYRRDQVAFALDGFGFLVPRRQGKTILGSLWTSSIFPGRAPRDHVLIRTMIGGMLEPQVGEWTDQQVIDTVLSELVEIIGVQREAEPTFLRLFRHARAIPQYHVGHAARVDQIGRAENRHPGFFAGGNALRGVGVLDCVRESTHLAERILKFLSAP